MKLTLCILFSLSLTIVCLAESCEISAHKNREIVREILQIRKDMNVTALIYNQQAEQTDWSCAMDTSIEMLESLNNYFEKTDLVLEGVNTACEYDNNVRQKIESDRAFMLGPLENWLKEKQNLDIIVGIDPKLYKSCKNTYEVPPAIDGNSTADELK